MDKDEVVPASEDRRSALWSEERGEERDQRKCGEGDEIVWLLALRGKQL